MSARRPHSARGVALLVVLAAVVVTSTALVALVQLAATASLDRTISMRRQIADDLLGSADTAARRWLAEKSALTLLPADVDADSPGVAVLDSHWEVPERGRTVPCRLTITAWDQCAMVPLAALQADRASSVRDLAPPDLVSAAHGIDERLSPGLDGFAPLRDEGRLHRPLFPARGAGGGVGSVGGWGGIATHNPSLEPDTASPPGGFAPPARVYRVNVCTAPMALIEAALRDSRVGGPQAYAQILAARTQGRRPNVGFIIDGAPAPAEKPLEHAAQLRPEFAAFSSCWSLRIDVHVGSFTKSWWAVYVQSSSTWECVQRCVIDE